MRPNYERPAKPPVVVGGTTALPCPALASYDVWAFAAVAGMPMDELEAAQVAGSITALARALREADALLPAQPCVPQSGIIREGN